MRSAEHFKIGFLKGLAELGVTPSTFEHMMAVKEAGFLSPLKDVAGTGLLLGRAGLGLAIGAPMAGGAILGAMGRSAASVDDEDLDEVKKKELTSFYRQIAREVRERQQYGR